MVSRSMENRTDHADCSWAAGFQTSVPVVLCKESGLAEGIALNVRLKERQISVLGV